MFAITFDMNAAKTGGNYPQDAARICADAGAKLAEYGFERVQSGFYICRSEDLANLFDAVNVLKTLPGFAGAVRDIRAFRIEMWSDFTKSVKTA